MMTQATQRQRQPSEYMSVRDLAKVSGANLRRLYGYIEQGIVEPDFGGDGETEFNMGQIKFLLELREGAPQVYKAGVRVEGEKHLPPWTTTLEWIGSSAELKQAIDVSANDEWVEGSQGASDALGIDLNTFRAYGLSKMLKRRGGDMKFTTETAAEFIRKFNRHKNGLSAKQLSERPDVPVSREWIRQRSDRIPHMVMGKQIRFDPAVAIPKILQLKGNA